MRNRLIFPFFLLVLVVACNGQENNTAYGPSYGSLDLGSIKTLDELIYHTGTIIEARKTGKVEESMDQGIEITFTELEVLNVLYGDPSLQKQKIRIFDLKSLSISLDKEDHYFLFLHPKTGRLGDDVYSIAGVYQGKFKVVNKKLLYDADKFGGRKTFQDELTNLSIFKATEKIQTKIQALKQNAE